MVTSEPNAQQFWCITESDVDAALDLLFAEDNKEQQGCHNTNHSCQESSQTQKLAPWVVEGLQVPVDDVSDLQAVLTAGETDHGKSLQLDSNKYMQDFLAVLAPMTYDDGVQPDLTGTAQHLDVSRDGSSGSHSSEHQIDRGATEGKVKRTKRAAPASGAAAAAAMHNTLQDLTKPGTCKATQQQTRPYKDQKRSNQLRIKQLEAEVQQKLAQLHVLESTNQDLRRKERLLQLSVASSQQAMAVSADSLGPALASIVKSFKGASHTMQTGSLVATLMNTSKCGDISFETMRTFWSALVMELGDALMAHGLATTPEARAAVEEHIAHINTSMLKCSYALGTHNSALTMQIVSRNLYTGEELDMRSAHDAWDDVVTKLNLAPEQVKDLAGVFEVFVRCTARNTSAVAHQLQQLQSAVDKQPAVCSVMHALEVHAEVTKVLPQLHHAMTRVHVLHLMVAHMTMNILTPVQGAGMIVHAMPRFGSSRMLVQAVHRAHVGVHAHNLLLQSYNYSALTGGWDPSSASALLATAATIASSGGAAASLRPRAAPAPAPPLVTVPAPL